MFSMRMSVHASDPEALVHTLAKDPAGLPLFTLSPDGLRTKSILYGLKVFSLEEFSPLPE